MSREHRVLLVGNPNVGKSTLFNRLTGRGVRVSNVPGTTVTQSRGTLVLPGHGETTLVDLPGTYSLAAQSPDERVTFEAILGLGADGTPDAVIVVLDAPRVMRSLYLALQVIELGVPVVFALNLMDEARAGGRVPRPEVLAQELGAPVLPIVARTGEGVPALLDAVTSVLTLGEAPEPRHGWSESVLSDVERSLACLPETLLAPAKIDASSTRARALALWALLSVEPETTEAHPDLPVQDLLSIKDNAREAGRDLASEIVGQRYQWIDAREPAIFEGAPPHADRALQERLDRVFLHPLSGIAIFFVTMFLVFQTLFSWSAPLVDAIDGAFGWLQGGVADSFATVAAQSAVAEIAVDLVVEGVIGGVGAVLVFIPQITLLFLFIALLEDCGYLSRAAHLMDRVLRIAGLPGQAFVPLLSGYACAVPSIIAARALPRWRDRLLTMLVVPLTSCSARLPVYVLVIAALFPASVEGVPFSVQALALFAMYLLSTAITVLAAIVLGRTILKDTSVSAMLELPPYRVPHLPTVGRATLRAVKDFVGEAGRVILVATICLWALLSFPRYETDDLFEPSELAQLEEQEITALIQTRSLERSYAGRVGKGIEPVIAPLGYDWKIGVGLIGSFAAREVFVSTMGLVYGIGEEVGEDDRTLHEKMRAERWPDGEPVYTPLVGASLMVFFALAMQCLSTLAVLKRETGGWRWPAFATTYMFVLAYLAALLVYQGGRLLGLG